MINADLFLNANDLNSISNMKIFDENNNEGMPHTWNDNLKMFKKNDPAIYDSINSATLHPDNYSMKDKNDIKVI